MLLEESKKIDEKLQLEYNNWKAQESELVKRMEETTLKLAEMEKTDKSENAEYQIAMATLAAQRANLVRLRTKIAAYLSYNRVKPGSLVGIGSTVRLKLLTINDSPITDREFVVKIVPAAVGVGRLQALSVDSVVGRAVLSKEMGDEFSITTRKGTIVYKITEVL